MPTEAQQLATIKEQILQNLADVTANPKPSYNIDGQQIGWTDYQRLLLEQLEKINIQIATYLPWEQHSVGYS